MTNRMKTALCALPLMLALLAACAQEMEAKEPEEAAAGLYKTQVQYSGENESTARYLEIAGRSQELLPLLEPAGQEILSHSLRLRAGEPVEVGPLSQLLLEWAGPLFEL